MDDLFQKRAERVLERLDALDKRVKAMFNSLNKVDESVKEPVTQKELSSPIWNYQDSKKRMEDLRKEQNESVIRSYRLKLTTKEKA